MCAVKEEDVEMLTPEEYDESLVGKRLLINNDQPTT